MLDLRAIRSDPDAKGTGSIVPLAFPIIAGAGTLSTILSLRAVYQEGNILVGILLNLIIVYIVLRASTWLEKKLGKSGFAVLRRVFGVILLAIAVKTISNYTNHLFETPVDAPFKAREWKPPAGRAPTASGEARQ